jgi:protein-L-isoaspartate(D-aspartate) O-methyltransferase
MAESNIEQARFNMVEQQVRPWEVLDQRVLGLLLEAPREAYVPEAYRNLAYADIEIPLGHDEHMMKPVLEGRMLQALNLQGTEKILEIGTGSGFITACLASLGAQVTSLDIHADLCQQAQANLEAQGIRNVTLKTTDALAGPIEGGPFDAIVITGSLPDASALEGFKSQLNAGGRLFAITGEAPIMEACLITRVGADTWQQEPLFETELTPLVNAKIPEQFSF